MRINEMTNLFIHVNADWEVETLSDTAMWIERTEFRRSDSNDRSACHFTHGPLCDLCASERRNPGSDRHRGQSPHSGTELNLRPPFHHRTADRRQRRGNDTGDTGTTQSSFSPSRPDTTATSSLPQHCYLHHTRRHRLSVSFSPVSHSLHLLSLCIMPPNTNAHALKGCDIEQLRALTWQYAVKATGSRKSDLCIDPNQHTVNSLRRHLLGTVTDLSIPKTANQWKPLLRAWRRVKPEHITTLLDSISRPSRRQASVAQSGGGNSVVIPPPGKAPKKRKSTSAAQPDSQLASPSNSDDDDSNGDDSVQRSGDDGDIAGDQDDDLSQDEDDGQADDDADYSLSHDTTERRSKKRRTQAATSARTAFEATTIQIKCSSCRRTVSFGDNYEFCPHCGVQWGGAGNASAASSASRSTGAAQKTKVWTGASKFLPRAIHKLVQQIPGRSSRLATLNRSIVEKARTGQQCYPLIDLLPASAIDRSAASSVLTDENSFLLHVDPVTNTITRKQGADTTEGRTLAARRRNITSFTEIAEVIIHSLIMTIYPDRPDICEQLFSLLTIALEITRTYTWKIALLYVDEIRMRSFDSHRGPGNTPVDVLDFQPTVNMGILDGELLRSLLMQETGSGHAVTTAGGSNKQSRQTGDGSKGGACHNWNKGRPCSKDPCPYAHSCKMCHSTAHPAINCSKRGSGGGASNTGGEANTPTVPARQQSQRQPSRRPNNTGSDASED
jgi:hypothetical protein